MSARFTVVPDPVGWARARADTRREGRPVVECVGEAGPGTTYAVVVDGAETAEGAVLAAMAGADLLLCCTAEDEVTDHLLDDLRHLGLVQREPSPLTVEQVSLLRRLHAGQSLGAAAAAEHLSRRTADRHLARARAALGVGTTAEALVVAGRLGLVD